MMMAGIGLDAQVISDLRPALKTRFGKAAYLIEVIRTLRRWPLAQVQIHMGDLDLRSGTVIVSRGKRYGGSFILAPEADLAGSTLHVTCFPSGPSLSVFARFLMIPLGLLRPFGLVDQGAVQSLDIPGPAGDPVQADGDVVTHLPAHISLSEQSIPFCVPTDWA